MTMILSYRKKIDGIRPSKKQTSPRINVPNGSRFPTDGTNRYLKAKRKERITLAKVSVMDDAP